MYYYELVLIEFMYFFHNFVLWGLTESGEGVGQRVHFIKTAPGEGLW